MNALPELTEAWLDAAGLEQLFSELSRDATVREVRVKGAAQRMAERGVVSLDAALARLRAGDVHGVQILYSFAGATFCDTVMPREGAWRVCRMQIP